MSGGGGVHNGGLAHIYLYLISSMWLQFVELHYKHNLEDLCISSTFEPVARIMYISASLYLTPMKH